MGFAVLGEPLDGQDLGVLELDRKGETREHRLAVHENGARAALAELTPVLRPRQTQVFAQHFEQRLPERHGDGDGLAVHVEMQNLLLGHSIHKFYHATINDEMVGVGIVRGEDGFLYITQEFSRPCEPRRRR